MTERERKCVLERAKIASDSPGSAECRQVLAKDVQALVKEVGRLEAEVARLTNLLRLAGAHAEADKGLCRRQCGRRGKDS